VLGLGGSVFVRPAARRRWNIAVPCFSPFFDAFVVKGKTCCISTRSVRYAFDTTLGDDASTHQKAIETRFVDHAVGIKTGFENFNLIWITAMLAAQQQWTALF
jgi:hypothetical protein